MVQQGPKLQRGVNAAQLGFSVALSADGNILFSGAWYETSGGFTNAGAVYVWTRSSSGVWGTTQRLVSNSPSPSARFGDTMVLSDDASIVAIAAYGAMNNQGCVYIFLRNATGAWVQQQQLAPIDGTSGTLYFGVAMSFNGDGNVLAIGAHFDSGGIGASFIFTRNATGAYNQLQPKLVGNGRVGGIVYQGSALSLSKDGSLLVVGGGDDSSYAGAVWTFGRNSSGLFSQVGDKLTANDSSIGATAQFGWTVSLSADGTHLLVSAPSAALQGVSNVGATFVFARLNGAWVKQQRLIINPTVASQQATSLAMAADGSLIAMGITNMNTSPNQGSVYVSSMVESCAVLPCPLTPPLNGSLGLCPADALVPASISCAIGCDFGFVPSTPLTACSATQGIFLSQQNCSPLCPAGSLTQWNVTSDPSTFQRLNTSYPLAGNGFGYSIALSGDGLTLAVGVRYDGPPTDTGSVFVYTRNALGVMVQQGSKLQMGVSGAQLGCAVGLSKDGNILLSGAYQETSSGLAQAGAAYVYQRSNAGVWGAPQRLASAAPVAGGYFGYALSMSDDASIFAIGAPGNGTGILGRVCIFIRDATGTWAQQQQLAPMDPSSGSVDFASTVQINGDGSVVAVGGYKDAGNTGATWIFTRNSTGQYNQLQPKLLGFDRSSGNVYQGSALSLSKDGSLLILGGHADGSGAGAVWTFGRNSSGLFSQIGPKLTANDSSIGSLVSFGTIVRLSADGTRLLVSVRYASVNGLTNTGAIFLFVRLSGAWVKQTRVAINKANLQQGHTLTMSADGARFAFGSINEGGTNTGAVYVASTVESCGAVCPSGRFSTRNNLASLDECDLCSANSNCPGNGSAVSCPSGMASLPGASSPSQCLCVVTPPVNGSFGSCPLLLAQSSSCQVRCDFGFTLSAFPQNTTCGVAGFTSQQTCAPLCAEPRQAGFAPQWKLIGSNVSTQFTKISRTVQADGFGISIALSGDGVTLAVGAPYDPVSTTDGSVSVYTRNAAGVMVQQGNKLQTGVGNAYLGTSVALSADGNILLSGAASDALTAGAAYVWTRVLGGVWNAAQQLVSTPLSQGANFGWTVAMSDDASIFAIAAPYDASNRGRVYIFIRNQTGLWTQQQQLAPMDPSSGQILFGWALSLSGDGSVLAIGGNGDSLDLGASFIFTRNSTNQYNQLQPKLIGSGFNEAIGSVQQGYSLSLSKDGSLLVVDGIDDSSYAGAVWTFGRNSSGLFSQVRAKLAAPDSGISSFGSAVSLSTDGTRMLVSAPSVSVGGVSETGTTYLFVRLSDIWVMQGRVTLNPAIANQQQTQSVAMSADGSSIALGLTNDLGVTDAGSVYFARSVDSCASCPPGRWSSLLSDDLLSNCHSCPLHSFCSGGSNLTACAAGRYTAAAGAADSAACVFNCTVPSTLSAGLDYGSCAANAQLQPGASCTLTVVNGYFLISGSTLLTCDPVTGSNFTSSLPMVSPLSCVVSVPGNATRGNCSSLLSSGAACSILCNVGFTPSRINTSCSLGTLTPQQCLPVPFFHVPLLINLTVAAGSLQPLFAPDVTQYNLSLPNNLGVLRMNLLVGGGGTVSVSAGSAAGGGNAPLPVLFIPGRIGVVSVPSGAPNVTVTVTAADGITSTNFTISLSYFTPALVRICASISGQAVLAATGCSVDGISDSSLAPQYRGANSGFTAGSAALSFVVGQRSYPAVRMPYQMSVINIHAETNWPSLLPTVQLELNGAPQLLTSAAPLASFALSVGIHSLWVNSSSSDAYELRIDRAPQDLFALFVNPPSGLQPPLQPIRVALIPDVLLYQIDVPYAASNVTLTALFNTTDTLVTLSLGRNSSPLQFGVPSPVVQLPAVQQTVTINLRSDQDGLYQLLVTRLAPPVVPLIIAFVNPPTSWQSGSGQPLQFAVTVIPASDGSVPNAALLQYTWGYETAEQAAANIPPNVIPSSNTPQLQVDPTLLAPDTKYVFTVTVTDPTRTDAAGVPISSSLSTQLYVSAPAPPVQVAQTVNIDPCAASSLVCLSGGSCVATAVPATTAGADASYTLSCNCPAGFFGQHCELAVLDCPSCVSPYTGNASLTLFGCDLDSVYRVQVGGHVAAFDRPFSFNSSTVGLFSVHQQMLSRWGVTCPGRLQSLTLITPALFTVPHKNSSTTFTTASVDAARSLMSAVDSSTGGDGGSAEVIVNPPSAYQLLTLKSSLLSESNRPIEVNISSLLFFTSSVCIAPGIWRDDGAGGCLPCPEGQRRSFAPLLLSWDHSPLCRCSLLGLVLFLFLFGRRHLSRWRSRLAFAWLLSVNATHEQLLLFPVCALRSVADSAFCAAVILYGVLWTSQLFLIALYLPYDSLKRNVQNVIVSFATLAHSAIFLGVQRGGVGSGYMIGLLVLFALVLAVVLFREKLATNVPWLRVLRRADMKQQEAEILKAAMTLEKQLTCTLPEVPSSNRRDLDTPRRLTPTAHRYVYKPETALDQPEEGQPGAPGATSEPLTLQLSDEFQRELAAREQGNHSPLAGDGSQPVSPSLHHRGASATVGPGRLFVHRTSIQESPSSASHFNGRSGAVEPSPRAIELAPLPIPAQVDSEIATAARPEPVAGAAGTLLPRLRVLPPLRKKLAIGVPSPRHSPTARDQPLQHPLATKGEEPAALEGAIDSHSASVPQPL